MFRREGRGYRLGRRLPVGHTALSSSPEPRAPHLVSIRFRGERSATICVVLGLASGHTSFASSRTAISDRPLIVVGGILTAAGLILMLVPVLYEIVHHRSANK